MGKTQKGRNDGKKHENKVDAAIRRLYPNNMVETNAKLPGVISGGKRQIDTLLHAPDGLTDFDAKDHTRNVNIDTVAEYAFKLKDEQVPHGVLVSASPYAPTALNTAKYYGIKPMHLIDTEDKENCFKIAQKTVLEDTIVESLRIGIQEFGLEPVSVPVDLSKVLLANDKGEQLPAYGLFQELWNEDKCPSDDGAHTISLHKQKAVMADGRIVAVTLFYFEYTVRTVYRKGKWAVEKSLGLYNASEGSLMTNGIASSVLSIDEMNEWPEISKEEADRPEYGMRLVAKSMLPDMPPTKAEEWL